MTENLSWPRPALAWRAVILLNLAYLLAFADRIILSLLAIPIQADLGLSDTQLGLLTGVAFGICYTVFGLPAGYLADRFSRRSLLALGVLIWSVMTMACGLAAGFVGLFVARVGVGIGEAVLHPTATSLIADYFAPERRPRAYSVYMMAGAAGTFFAFLLGGQLLRAITSMGAVQWPVVGALAPWQVTFIAIALPGILLAFVIIAIMPEPVRRGGMVRAGDRGATRALVDHLAKEPRMFVCLMLGVPLLLVGSYSMVAWLPVIFERTYGWPPAVTAVNFALTAGISSIVGTLVLGWVVERLRARSRADATFLMCLGGGLMMNIFAGAAMLMPTPEQAMMMLTVAAFFLLAPGIAGVACIADIAPNSLRAKVSALFTLMAGLITNTAGPFMVGLVTDQIFRDPAKVALSLLTVIAVCGTLGAILIFAGLRPYARVARQNAAQYS